jgi:phosphotransferase system IIB component
MTLVISFLVGLVLGVIGMKMTRKAPEVAAAKTIVETVVVAAPRVAAKPASVVKDAWYAGLGGEDNVQQAEAIAATRVRVSLQDGRRLNESALKAAGVLAVAPISAQVFHLIVGPQAA